MSLGRGGVCGISSVDDALRRQNCILLVRKQFFAHNVDDSRNSRDRFSITNYEENLGF